MFSADFYPTDKTLIDQLAIDCYDKNVLEPSAGCGNIVDWLNENGARSVIACEKDDRLRKILQDKCRIIQNDFFDVTAIDISHIELIVMNPPFSHADKHILHAWEIAPEGCEIVALCNKQTVENDYSRQRKELLTIIEDYGDKTYLGKVFKNAERQTDVEVSLVRLFKPVTRSDFDFEGFYLSEDTEKQENGIMTYNEIRAIVNSYVASVKCFDEFREVADRMNRCTDIALPDPSDEEPSRLKHFRFGSGFSFNVSYDKRACSKEDFTKEMQRHCWQVVFDRMNIRKYVTKGVMEDINKFIEGRKNYPFTMKNVYRMLEVIIGTREHTMNRAIIEAIDNLTKYTHENRYNLPGWKTNAGHLLNKKFIVDWMVEHSEYSGFHLRWSSNYQYIDDLIKALCYVTGRHYDDCPTIRGTFDMFGKNIQSNHWYYSGLFEFKFFKKGTMHIKFQNESDWEKINRAYAKAKGEVLPENINMKEAA